MLSRREILKGLAVAAVAAPVTAGVVSAVSSRRSRHAVAPECEVVCLPPEPIDEPVAPAPWDLLSPLVAGSEVWRGWKIESLSPVVAGAAVLVLAKGADSRVRVHICRNDGRPRGGAFTPNVDLVIMNGGMGSSPTEESVGCAVIGLARAIEANERAGGGQATFPFLETHEVRLQKHGRKKTALT